MRLTAAPRWAISFADLALLLLGCFVMLHVMRTERTEMASAPATAGSGMDLVANDLFEPGEARLTSAGRARLQAIAAGLQGRRLALVSRGGEAIGPRLDTFELAAARTAAIARALADDQGRVSIEMAGGETGPQRIVLRVEP